LTGELEQGNLLLAKPTELPPAEATQNDPDDSEAYETLVDRVIRICGYTVLPDREPRVA